MATSSLHTLQRPLPARRQNRVSRALTDFSDKSASFLTKHWAKIITSVLGILVFAAISVPFLSYLGLDVISKPIFYTLHYVCAQIPSHSFYIFGHQLGMCARNFSIYASMFVGSLIFTLSGNRMRGIPWWAWILLMVPIALDGFTQMFGLRESSWELRLLTGTLFGFGNVWFALPMMQKSLELPVLDPRQAAQAIYEAQMRANAAQQVVPVMVVNPTVQTDLASTYGATPRPISPAALDTATLQDYPFASTEAQ
ncbi:DUF2085 domain-containing protein [Ktedonospora formicarum]|uniref:DUF2085 domain-containing protein n=1 Tax=Ktedonospora formicarum TaxID=2778364 RepID=A0A8J3HWT2_9CHLR|nr:DUF2085 domain-containing protein [Ktedonospora formicarum]GHO45527.1 hypothetical protein KSX_36900 [Ktedonospora formicarum]